MYYIIHIIEIEIENAMKPSPQCKEYGCMWYMTEERQKKKKHEEVKSTKFK